MKCKSLSHDIERYSRATMACGAQINIYFICRKLLFQDFFHDRLGGLVLENSDIAIVFLMAHWSAKGGL